MADQKKGISHEKIIVESWDEIVSNEFEEKKLLIDDDDS